MLYKCFELKQKYLTRRRFSEKPIVAFTNCTVYIYVDPPVGWGSTYCFTAVGVGVLVGVGVTSITKAPPAQIFLGWHVFCSPGHWLLISAMTLTFGVKVKL